ncbi:MAG: hypothetical protein CL607_03685 [Anaerolineaceae bacterium]|nr:hypothetical protein [Anaerolineaceae bacterium]
MDFVAVLLIVAVVTSGFFVGIIVAMIGVIQTVLNGLDYATFTSVMQAIIVSGRKSPFVWAFLLLPIIASMLALILLWDAMTEAPFFWTVVGLVLFVAGPLLVSRLFNEPYYDQVMTWKPDAEVPGWEQKRTQWFRLNLLRFSIGSLACVAFALALAAF